MAVVISFFLHCAVLHCAVLHCVVLHGTDIGQR